MSEEERLSLHNWYIDTIIPTTQVFMLDKSKPVKQYIPSDIIHGSVDDPEPSSTDKPNEEGIDREDKTVAS